jgi:D-xylose transport system substrate-binding protein
MQTVGTAGTMARSDSTAGPVSLLLPNKANPRWRQDADAFTARLGQLAPTTLPVVLNARNSETTQVQQARTALSNGAKVLVVSPVSPDSAGQIVALAYRRHVPVIAYDLPIEARHLNLFVGFDPQAVGRLQGSFVARHASPRARLVYINGPADDEVATAQYQGYSRVLQSKLRTRRLTVAESYWTASWSSAEAEADMIDALFRTHGRVQGVLAANDTLAAGVIRALAQAHLRHPVMLTGSDATLSGLRAILVGSQSMTVYKPVYLEADAAAEATAAYLSHAAVPGAFNRQFKMRAGTVRAALFTPQLVTASTMTKTVLKDHFVTRSQLCAGLEASCRKHHI